MKKYLLPALLFRVQMPLLGAVPWNIATLSGFTVLGLENPVFWAAGGVFEVLWLTCTAGRSGWRRRIDAQARRQAWRELESGRLALYHRLSPAGRARHHALREKCHPFLTSSGPVTAPDPPPGTAFTGPVSHEAETRAALDLFTWLHLKLLLFSESSAADQTHSPDAENLHRLRAVLMVDINDPAAAALAERALDLLELRPLSSAASPARLTEIDALLAEIETGIHRVVNGLQVMPAARNLPHFSSGDVDPFPAEAGPAAQVRLQE